MCLISGIVESGLNSFSVSCEIEFVINCKQNFIRILLNNNITVLGVL